MRGKPSPEKWELVAYVIPLLCELLNHEDEEILTDAW